MSWNSATPDESTILRFRHLLEKHKLAEQILKTVTDLLVSKKLLLRTGTIVDATLIAAPSSTKNSTHSRDPEMHQTKKGNQWYFGMKAHIGVDADSGLVHTVRETSGNVNDVVEANSLEVDGYGDAGSYLGKPGRFRVNKRKFGHVKFRYRGLKKNTQQLNTLFALANL